jgi:hypothetical protein
MVETPVPSWLVAKRAEITGQIEHTQDNLNSMTAMFNRGGKRHNTRHCLPGRHLRQPLVDDDDENRHETHETCKPFVRRDG